MSTDPQPVRAAQARMRHQAAGYADCPYTADDIAADEDCLVCGEPGDMGSTLLRGVTDDGREWCEHWGALQRDGTPCPDGRCTCAEGSQLLASRQWRRLLVDRHGDPWWPLGDGRARLANPGDETADTQSEAYVVAEFGPVREVVLVPVGEAEQLLADVAKHAKTRSNFEEFAEGALETQQRLRAELAAVTEQREQASRSYQRADAEATQLRAELSELRACHDRDTAQAERWRGRADRLRAELEVVGARAGWSGMLAAHLRMLCQAVEQAGAADDHRARVAGAAHPLGWQAVQRAAAQARAALDALDQHAPPPATPATGTTLTVPDSPKALRETLCVAQGTISRDQPAGRSAGHIARLQRLIDACDQAQTLYAGLPNLPLEPAVADEPEAESTADYLARTAAQHPDTATRAVAGALGDFLAGRDLDPPEPAEPTDDQLTHWREHHDHAEGADHG